MNRRPLVAVACSFIAGTAVFPLCPGKEAFVALASLLILLFACAIAGIVTPKLVLVCGTALLLAYGERAWQDRDRYSDLEISLAESGIEAELHGRISSAIEVDGDLVSFMLKADKIRLASDDHDSPMTDTVVVRIRLSKQSDQEVAGRWRRGDGFLAKGTLELPGEAGNFGAFDYRSYLIKQGIYWQLSVKGLGSVNDEKKPVPLSMQPLRFFDDARNTIGALMDRLFPGGDSGYMKGLVIGIRSDLDPAQYDSFARIGMTHVLAISGLHVGVVVYLLLQVGAWIRLTRERSLDITIAMMPVYMMITGASPSVVRACLMAMIALWLARKQALKDGLHLLFAAAMAMLIWNPTLIEEIAFQLSFLVTLGLILFVPTVSEWLPFRWKRLNGALAVTVTAQAVSFPVTVYYFHSMHLLSLPANFLLVPFISMIVMPLGMAAVALGAIWLPLGIVPAKLATLGNRLTFAVVDWLNGFVDFRTIWPQPPLIWVVCAYALMGVGLVGARRLLARRQERAWWIKQAEEQVARDSGGGSTAPLYPLGLPDIRQNRLKSYGLRAAFGLACACWLLWGYRPAWADQTATVSFINVGQGDSILIRTGQGKYILVDAGGTIGFRKPGDEWKERRSPYEVGHKLLVPLLLKRGVREIDALVLTHLDEDHIGGARAVLDHIPVRALLFNGTVKTSPGALAVLNKATDKQIPAYSVHAPMEWTVDRSAHIRALYPLSTHSDSEADAIERQDDQNASSVVLHVTLYGRNFLLPGDLEAKGEREIVDIEYEQGHNAMQGTIDVLKAGHHGSKTSSTGLWVSYWLPTETVISVGKNNFYGHPNMDVLQRLEVAGSRVWRTDLDGEVQYRIHPGGAMERRVLRQ
ncbi:DNA internalization-related competence protein ComEC/Rec2 [Cohnella terricola]|uniref:DNA internalization-related competence protein ComEC/Rec2 n=1 Tax=Cohnella terricola TaxID=1289167 RepID=A0A559JKV3_9BACL|nr:DNA internalization-related competence protein ComEC/Rec2 [Cohnella terricola]TVY00495.1 DNA internalization-related competence protein ComEC/Rec2 [Cohnella terricola]